MNEGPEGLTIRLSKQATPLFFTARRETAFSADIEYTLSKKPNSNFVAQVNRLLGDVAS